MFTIYGINLQNDFLPKKTRKLLNKTKWKH